MSDPIPTLVGEQNPYSLDPDDALLPFPAQSAGARLARILGLSRSQYLRTFRRANLVDGPGYTARLAREKAWQLVEDPGVLVLLGRRVCAAFGVRTAAFQREGRFYVLPHPSGMCRVWNEPDAVDRARRLLREFLP